MARIGAHIISYLFHPLFVITYILLILFQINPYLFSVQDLHSKGLLVISVVMLSVFFPILAIVMMKALGLIQSIEMKDRTERIGPLIVTGLFYLWLFVNIKNNNLIPEAFSFFVLGATIGLFIAFFINNFSKISLHTVGAGGLLAGVFLIRYFFSYESFLISLGSMGIYKVHVDLLLMLVIIIVGLIGSSRLVLKAHDSSDIYGGYLVGILSQIIAFRILI